MTGSATEIGQWGQSVTNTRVYAQLADRIEAHRIDAATEDGAQSPNGF